MARRSVVLTIFIVIFAAACAGSRPTATPTSTPPPALVAAPPTVAPTESAPPTEAPTPTKKPRKTKKPKPTPTPEVWTPAYRSRVCAAIGDLSDTKAHVDGAAAHLAAGQAPQARSDAFEVIALTVKANDSLDTTKAWPPGDDLKEQLKQAAKTLGDGATHFLAGLTALDFDVMHAAGGEMNTGGDELAQAQVALAGLSATYGPAGC